MANLKEIRIRISSVQGTKQITSAMKMVSAAKLRKAQDTIIQMRPYAYRLQSMLVNLTQSLESSQDNVYGTPRDVKKVLIVAISSNKGLCGAFNSNVAKRVIEIMDTNYSKQKEDDQIEIITVGKKASDLLLGKGVKVNETMHDLLDNLNYDMIAALAKRIMKSYVAGLYDEVQIVYNQFRNAAIQQLLVEQFLPIFPTENDMEETILTDYILEPSQKSIFDELIPKSLKIQLYKAFLESAASEHGARMTSMHKATDNATDLIKELQLEYNKARQASITKEILEIVGGANALSG
jgi:F-type H+-transporting ATPase subunit gamma